MPENTLIIRPLGEEPAVLFAAAELQRYIAAMTGTAVQPEVIPSKAYDGRASHSLWLIDASHTPTALQILASSMPAVDDPAWDDRFAADVTAGSGVIIGGNPRSVLIAAYALLTAAGCRWVRPGQDGEIIPQAGLNALNLKSTQAASYRHRGICIEGACSYENVADIIDWAPKVGYNAYFTQFRESYTFFERWYSHRGNPNRGPEPFTVEMAREFLGRAQAEMAKRGLLYHAVGHGWTCEPLGLAGLGWDAKEYTLPPETQIYLAEVNGVRAVWKGIPLNTNLCYSNPEVRKLVNTNIVEYAAEHPNVDALHFWLADDSNNQCECANCRAGLPSDFYVQMLNELDEMLSARGIPTKIVFLVYVDLLWPPEHQRFINQERFILMFAPITRSYTKPFSTEGPLPAIPPFERNKLKFPKNVSENVAFLRGWQKIFSGDSFDFDYHLMWDHFNDPSYASTARILGEDIKRLRDIGINGYMSCQLQRVFFPTGLPMYVLGQTLWDEQASFEAVSADYYAAAFGPDGSRVETYLNQLSELFSPPYIRGERPIVDAATAEGFAQVEGVVQAFKPEIEANLQRTSGAQATSWQYLAIHAEYCIRLAEALQARAHGDQEHARETWQGLVQFVWDQEPTLQPVLDTFLFVNTMNRRFI